MLSKLLLHMKRAQSIDLGNVQQQHSVLLQRHDFADAIPFLPIPLYVYIYLEIIR